jgi:outer membrane immunogenic protein
LRNLNLVVSAYIAVCAIFGVDAANAADLPAQIRTEAPAGAPVTLYNWTSCYLGGYVGAARQSRQVNAYDPASTGGVFPAGTFYHAPSADPTNNEFNYDFGTGLIGGGTLGCNWQGASPWVVGIEGEGGYMKVSGSRVDPFGGSDTVASTRIGDWYAALAGRFGHAWDRVLVYLKGGVGFSTINSSMIDACSAAPCSPGLLTTMGSTRQPFWLAGVGVEYAFSENWSVKGEFLVLGMYKTYDVCGPGAAAAAGSKWCGPTNVEGLYNFKVGVNYYFNTLARTYAKAPIADPVYNWRGFYVGANGGYGSSLNCFDYGGFLSDASFLPIRDNCITAGGGLAGGQIGYRWQSGAWIFGLELQGDWASLNGTAVSTVFPGNSRRTQIDALGLFTGQVGYGWNSTLIYVRAGAAVAPDRYDTFVTGTNMVSGSTSETRWGGSLGTGVEFGFVPDWSVAVEYDHLFLQTRNITFNVPAIAPTFDGIHQDINLATVRVNYRWGAPVVAKY